MFGLFKRKERNAQERAEALFMKLRSLWRDVIELVEHVDGKFAKLHEAGLFVGIMALLELARHHGKDVEQLADEFATLWLVYVADNPNEPERPPVGELSALLEQRYAAYKTLMNNIALRASDPEKAPHVQLVWELVANCTGKQAPADFTKLMPAAAVLLEVVAEITVAAREAVKR